MVTVMLDLNVLLDVVQKREPFYAASATVLSQAVEESGTSCLPGHVPDHPALHRRQIRGPGASEYYCGLVLAHLEIVPQDRAQFVRARNLRFDDFEDAALASAAEAAGCRLILTRNVVGFGASPVPAVTPEEFLLTASQG